MPEIVSHQANSGIADRVTLCCPHCRGALDQDDPQIWHCQICERSYPVCLGIPDLRAFGSLYGSPDQEATMIRRLLDAYPTASFADLIRLRFGENKALPDSLRAFHMAYRLQDIERGETQLARAAQWLAQGGKRMPETGPALEIGCGTGGALIPLAQRLSRIAGIDISMTALILAKKRLEERGIGNLTLACACAEALPFTDNTFCFGKAVDVIEHVESQEAAVREAYRVVSDNGVAWFSSPNRWQLFGLEPHVLVWGVGLLPRALQNPYVRLVKGVEYRGKRLLSRFELTTLLRKAAVNNYLIADPDPLVPASRPARTGRGRVLRRWAPWLVRAANWSVKYFGNEFNVFIIKPVK